MSPEYVPREARDCCDIGSARQATGMHPGVPRGRPGAHSGVQRRRSPFARRAAISSLWFHRGGRLSPRCRQSGPRGHRGTPDAETLTLSSSSRPRSPTGSSWTPRSRSPRSTTTRTWAPGTSSSTSISRSAPGPMACTQVFCEGHHGQTGLEPEDIGRLRSSVGHRLQPRGARAETSYCCGRTNACSGFRAVTLCARSRATRLRTPVSRRLHSDRDQRIVQRATPRATAPSSSS